MNDKWKKIKNYEKFFKDLGEIKGNCYGKKGILKELIPKIVMERMAELLLKKGEQVEYVKWTYDIDYDAYAGFEEWRFEFLVDGEWWAFNVNSLGIYFGYWAVFSYVMCVGIYKDGETFE